MCGKGACMAGRMCMVGGMHGRGNVWQGGYAGQGVCVAGGMHGREACFAPSNGPFTPKISSAQY